MVTKKELFDTFDQFSADLSQTQISVEELKRQIEELLEENSTLRLENNKLRDRLLHFEQSHQEKSNSQPVRNHLEGIYTDGFHVCNLSYGQRRDGDCAFCLELLYREP